MTTHDPIDEKELLLRLKGGDKAAFEKIYGLYSLRIYSNITRLVQDEDVAEDLLQDLFTKVWDQRQDIDPGRSFLSYLFTCSRNMVYNYLRRVSIEKQAALYLSRVNTELYDHVEQHVDYLQTDAAFRSAVQLLPEQRRKVYTMCKLDGLTYEEAAQSLGISRSAVKDHIVKANRFIGNHMKGLDSTYMVLLLSCLIAS